MSDTPDPDRLITGRQFAARAAVSVVTVNRWRYEGTGPTPYRFGYRTVRYNAADVEQFVKTRADPPPAAVRPRRAGT